GGAVGPVDLAPAVTSTVHDAVQGLSAALRLGGLVSFDFLLVDGTPWPLEVKPPPTPPLDGLHGRAGALVTAHPAPRAGEVPRLTRAEGARAAAILYADRGALSVGALPWPGWSGDRPAPGTRIPRHRPIATVFARGATPEQALRKCRERLD